MWRRGAEMGVPGTASKVGDDGSDYVIEAYLDIRQIATRE